jgi:hypothetical protein
LITIVSPPAIFPLSGTTDVIVGVFLYSKRFGWLQFPLLDDRIETGTNPKAAEAPVRQTILVGVTVCIAAGTVPMVTLTVAPASQKSEPSIVTVVPPCCGPKIGLINVTVGNGLYRYALGTTSVPCEVDETMSATAPEETDAGVSQVIVVWPPVTCTLVAAPEPNVTLTVPPNPVPVIVTRVFPSIGPLSGTTLRTDGGEL